MTKQLTHYELTNWQIIAPEMTEQQLKDCERVLDKAAKELAKQLNVLAGEGLSSFIHIHPLHAIDSANHYSVIDSENLSS